MHSIGNLKPIQMKKLLQIFESILIQCLRNFGSMEDIRFEFRSSSYFWKIEKIPNRAGPPISARFRTAPRRPCTSAVQTAIAAIFAPGSCHRFCHCPWFSLPIKLTQGRDELPLFASSSLLFSAPLSLLYHRRPALPLPITPELPLCCPTGPKESPQRPVPPASSSSPGHRLPKPGNRGSRAPAQVTSI
jgi:hypothetical protein